MSETVRYGREQDGSREVILDSLQKILHSKIFSHSSSLRDALEYIVKNSLSSSPDIIKEYSIATDVLGRPKDFNPKADNIVRVQMYRLREKLDEYYSSEGFRQPIRIVIPRGKYTPEFVTNAAEAQAPDTVRTHSHGTMNIKREGRNWLRLGILASLACNLLLLAAILRQRRQPAASGASLPPALATLWQPIFSSNGPVLVIYANPAFLVGKRGNLYRYNSPTVLSMPMGALVPTLGNSDIHPSREERDGPFYYFDSYAGSGDLEAAARVAQFLTAHGKSFVIKRSRIVSFQDVKDQNVVFLGGDKEDQVLAELPITQDIVFESPPTDDYPLGSSIRDRHPAAGQPDTYRFGLDPVSSAIKMDYAVVSLLPNVSAGHYVLVLAGLSTLGSEAAAGFVTSEESMAAVVRMRNASATSPSRSFQVLLRVPVRDGVPLGANCILARNLKPPAH